MSYGLVQLTAPSGEPVTLTEAKRQARVDISTDDDLINDQIAEARVWCEEYTRRAFVSRTFRLTMDCFPGRVVDGATSRDHAAYPYGITYPYGFDATVRIPRCPVASVDAVKYIAGDGTLTTLDADKWQADLSTDPARVLPAWGTFWPFPRPVLGAVQIEFTAGYGTAADVPKGLKRAVKMLAAHWYDSRGIVETSGAIPKEIPFTLESMLAPFCWEG